MKAPYRTLIVPRFPQFASTLENIGGSVYSSLAHRLKSHTISESYPLHVGDTWLEPADGCRMEDLRVECHPGMHRYSDPQGLPTLIEAVAGRVAQRTSTRTSNENVLITAGATGALGAVMGAIVEPGNEVLILAPYWPLITGIVRCFHGEPVVVPVIGEAQSADAVVALVERAATSRTVALYLSTPNNPTGRVMPGSWVEALVRWASRRDLWIVSDEVYEDYIYTGVHTYARPLAPERVFSAFSFSKAFGMAGNRCGYVVGPASAMGELRKVSTHSFYSTPTASQIAALRALDGRGDLWIADVRKRYQEMGARAAARLGVAEPEGSTFLFLNVGERLDNRGLLGFLEDCADDGLFLAPGPSFGPYPNTCASASPAHRPRWSIVESKSWRGNWLRNRFAATAGSRRSRTCCVAAAPRDGSAHDNDDRPDLRARRLPESAGTNPRRLAHPGNPRTWFRRRRSPVREFVACTGGVA
jgi:aspartate/methionine/tyrosine aminotransferase